MLFTRCPGCQTTFRLTANMLNMASGHVRCGSCAMVFSAYSGLREDLLAESLEGDELLSPTMQTREAAGLAELDGPELARANTAADAAEDGDAEEPLAFGAAAAAPPAAPADSPTRADDDAGLEFDAPVDDWAEVLSEIQSTADANTPVEPPGDDRAETDAGQATAEHSAEATSDAQASVLDRQDPAHAAPDDAVDPQARSDRDRDASAPEIRVGAYAATPGAATDADISDEQIDATLAADPDEALLAALETQRADPDTNEARSPWWGIGAAVALALLAGQLVHHFRAPLAGRSLIGPMVQDTYGFLGLEVQPDWDLAQYEILNWAAQAGTAMTTGIGNLKITAQIRNNGPRAQPYPRIHLELKDRWEAVVGSRVFAPREYLPAATDATALMPAGAAVPADLSIIDPGTEASGFELDICLELEPARLSCAADRVFE